MVDVRNSSDIVVQRDIDVQATYNPVVSPNSAIQCSSKFPACNLQSCSLEDVIVPLFDFRIIVWIPLLRHLESVVIVYGRNVLGYIVMKPRIHHQHHAYPRRLPQQSLFSEGVRF